MKILVTGADGFIGSHLVELLLKKKNKVRALVFYNSFGHNGHLDSINKTDNLEIVKGDIRDRTFTENICKGIDVVIHLASLISIPFSYTSSQSYLDTNVLGTHNICEAVRKNKNKKLIVFSTSEVYGTAKYVPIDENHPMQPQSPYSASKIAADALSMSYYYSFGINLTIIRPFNTYGPRQSTRAIIPTIISQILQNKKKIQLGITSTKRDLTYVGDTCNAVNLLVKNFNKFAGETFNVGSNNSISISDMVKRISKIMNLNIKIIRDEKRIRPLKSEVLELDCDYSKLNKLTGYKPSVSMDMGLKKTILWLKKDFIKNKNKDYSNYNI
jgi:NAD dependent epimerase/dehydratase